MDIGEGKIGIAESLEEKFPESGPDAVLIAAPMQNDIRLDSEIKGVTAFAASIAARTVKCDYPVLCGCVTRFADLRHVSVMTFGYGRLLDIADRTLNLGGGNFCEGDTIKVLRMKNFDLGLLVDTDVLLAKNWRKIALHCDAVAGIALGCGDADFAYIPTLASLFGKPYAVALSGGEILWGNPRN